MTDRDSKHAAANATTGGVNAADPQEYDPRQGPVSVVPAEGVQAEVVQQRELGGPAGPEPTRFGDWERKGRCIDF